MSYQAKRYDHESWIVVDRFGFYIRDRDKNVPDSWKAPLLFSTESEANAEAILRQKQDDAEVAAQEERLAEHKRQKTEQERQVAEDLAERKRIDAAGVYAANIRKELDAARTSEATIRRLIDQWQSDLLTKQAELDAVKLSIKTYETEIRRILANTKGGPR